MKRLDNYVKMIGGVYDLEYKNLAKAYYDLTVISAAAAGIKVQSAIDAVTVSDAGAGTDAQKAKVYSDNSTRIAQAVINIINTIPDATKRNTYVNHFRNITFRTRNVTLQSSAIARAVIVPGAIVEPIDIPEVELLVNKLSSGDLPGSIPMVQKAANEAIANPIDATVQGRLNGVLTAIPVAKVAVAANVAIADIKIKRDVAEATATTLQEMIDARAGFMGSYNLTIAAAAAAAAAARAAPGAAGAPAPVPAPAPAPGPVAGAAAAAVAAAAVRAPPAPAPQAVYYDSGPAEPTSFNVSVYRTKDGKDSFVGTRPAYPSTSVKTILDGLKQSGETVIVSSGEQFVKSLNGKETYSTLGNLRLKSESVKFFVL